MKKEEKEKIELDEKEESKLGLCISIGVMIGTAIGAMLSMIYTNIMFLGGGSALGLLLGTVIGSISKGK